MRLSKKVISEDRLPENIKFVAGVDVAYVGNTSIGAVAVLDLDSFSLVESRTAKLKTRFPYVPTLLSFREVPPALLAIRKLQRKPDVFMVDGQGIAHPYRLGFASHLGLVANVPTIGVAKSLLCGEAQSFSEKRWAPIVDEGDVIGASVITELGKKPVYVSVGHRVSLEKAIELVLHCARGCRIPEPIRKAHMVANEERRKLIDACYK
jgi:deoxyribonuclease V